MICILSVFCAKFGLLTRLILQIADHEQTSVGSRQLLRVSCSLFRLAYYFGRFEFNLTPCCEKRSRENTVGDPGEIRTLDLQIRSQLLYPAELRGQTLSLYPPGVHRRVRSMKPGRLGHQISLESLQERSCHIFPTGWLGEPGR